MIKFLEVYEMALQDYLYSEKTVPDVLERYIKELASANEIQHTIHANKLASYQNAIKDKQYLKDMRKLFNEMYDLLDKNHPKLQFYIDGRRKSLISTERKILQYNSLEQSLDLIRDFFAFRIILFGDHSINLILHCYKVMEEIINFAAKQGFTPCKYLPLVDVANINEPQNDYFQSFQYNAYIKDYICFPKQNGYQSLHLVLVDTKGRQLEIQVKTLEMHANNETGEASHLNYKEKKYNIDFPLDRNKISINGYSYVNGKVFDYAGVERHIIVFQRQKTF